MSYSWTRHLSEVLESVVGQSYPHLDILLVDNKGPASAEVAAIAARFPSVRLMQNHANLGFSGGMNAGIRAARGHYTYLTEDDVVLRPGCIAALAACMNDHADAGLAAPIMYNKHAGTIRSAGGRFSLGPPYAMKIFGEGDTDAGQFREPFDVTYIPGASIFARTELLRAMNGFREDFFIYHEDAELCMRILKAGYRILTVPAAGIDHFEPPDGQPSEFVSLLRYRNFYALYLLHAPARVLPAFFVRYGALDVARALLRRRGHAWLMIRGWGWVLRRLPTLVADRDSRPFPPSPDHVR